MKFIKTFIRRTCLFLGGLVLFSIVMSVLAGIVAGNKKTLPEGMILTFDITEPVGETAHSRAFADPFASPGMTVREFVETLDVAAVDKRVRGVVVSLKNGGIDMAHVQEIRAAVKRFRRAEKPIYIYTPSFGDLGSGIGAYYLASAFEEIWMQPVGLLSMSGIALDMPFAKNTLDKIGVEAQFLHREEYKSAMESFTNKEMSPANREMMSSILNDISTQIFKGIAQDRSLDENALRALIDKGLFSGATALDEGLIDRLDYPDILRDEMQEAFAGADKAKKPEFIAARDYHSALFKKRKAPENADVALVHVSGEIVPGDEPEPGYATGDYIADAITEASENSNIKVIVVRVNSPGGSPSASETIRRAIVRAKEKGKKILVSMGPVAASGGYWITVDADKIFALPSTLTGSVGVIMGKFEVSGLWKKLGVNWDGVSWGRNARLWSVNQPMDENARSALNDAIDATYGDFIDRVAEGRKMEPAEVRKIAKGRAWTGMQAKENGLVDEIGGLDNAMEYAADLLGVSSRSRLKIIELPKPLTPLEQIVRLMEGQVSMGPGLSLLENFGALTKPVDVFRRGGPVQAYDHDLSVARP